MASTIDPSAVLGQLIDSYLKLPLAQKIVFPILIVGCISGIVYVSRWANRPDYAVLYSDLEPTDSGAVIEKLKAQKVKYQIEGDGRTVSVSPPEIVHELRISLAADGVPRGGKIGFEIFDSTNLGTTTFVEKLKWLRALQGELERTIVSLDAIAAARVHITQPEKSIFSKKGSDPTASVMLKLKTGGELSKKQIKGITNLVAGSVENLKPENVNIIDMFGNLLTTPEDEAAEGLGLESARLQYQRDLERRYVERIESMLSKVVGPEKVVARVSTEVDYSSSEREEESYDPGGQVLRSERTIEEGAGSSQRGGVPGVVSNVTNDPSLLAPQSSAKDTSNRNEAVKNYEVSRAITRSNTPRGRMVRMSVAVLVDGNYAKAPAGEGQVFSPLSEDILRQIEDIVKSATGFDSSRGDTLSVESIPFQEADGSLISELDKKEKNDFILGLVSKGIPIAFILLFFFIVVRPLIKFMITPTEAETDLSRLLPTGLEELEQELQTERTKAEVPTFEPSIDLNQLEELIAENSGIVKKNPAQAALLIRYWLNDGRML